MDVERHEVTRILHDVTDGDEAAGQELLAAVYEELRALAGASFRGQPGSHTLQPTALANEAYIRLVDRTGIQWKDRSHFFALAAVIMRGILADHARKRSAAKRGGDWQRITLAGIGAPDASGEIDLMALDEALEKLSKVSARQSRVVEYRFFGGLTVEQVADLLDVSVSTVEVDWRIARAWLAVQLEGEAAP